MASKYREAQLRFKELLEDVNRADHKILCLFPNLDFKQPGVNARASLGMKTALRVLLVCATEGYVNHQLLDKKYAVGGDSRKRALPRLHNLRLLSRSEGLSSKNVRKDAYRLSDKGVLLCSAFPRIFGSHRYTSLIANNVSNKHLSRTMLALYLQPSVNRENRLLIALREVSDSGLNVEHVSENSLADRLLVADESISGDSVDKFVFRAFETFIDFHQFASPKIREHTKQNINEIVDFAFTEPQAAKHFVALMKDVSRFVRTTDFQVWLRLTHASPKEVERLQHHILEMVQAQIGRSEEDNPDKLRILWEKRTDILEAVRKWLREDIFSQIRQLHPDYNEGIVV